MKQASSQSKKGERVALDFCAKTELVEARRWMERLIWKLLDVVGKSAPLVLEANCMDGRDTEIFLQRGARIVSVCSSEKQLEFARRRVPDGDFRLLDLLRLDLPDGEFDAVWCVGHQMAKSDTRQILSELAGVLKSNGLLTFDIRTDVGENLDELKMLLPQFEILECESYPIDFFTNGLMHITARKR
jgi:SAM-dependent methyltransferase